MRRRTSVLLAVAGAALVATGCGVDPDVVATRADPVDAAAPPATPADTEPDEPAGTEPPTTTPVTAPPATAPPSTASPATAPPTTIDQTPGGDIELADVVDVGEDKPPRDYDAFVAAALTDLGRWWDATYPDVYGATFVPLEGGVIAAYPTRSSAVPGCGEEETTYPEVNEFVAFYCPIGDFLVYDDGPDSLLGVLTDEFGPSIMGVVLAHEYGHAVQQRNGDLARDQPSIVTEQQADCFAGAWMAHAMSGESETIRLTDADLRSSLIALVTVRDPVGIDQRTEGGHGSAFDRVGAFQEGFREGVARCAELVDDPLPLLPNTFTSVQDELNDGDLAFGFEEGTIGGEIVTALDAFWSEALAGQDASGPDLTLTPVTDLGALDDVPGGCRDGRRPLGLGVAVCPSAGVVAVDETFARQLYDDPLEGRADFAVAYLIGTAWAERAQELLGSELDGEARALANDCLVGAWTQGLRSPTDEQLSTLSPGDLDEAVLAAITIGDPGSGDDVVGSAFEKIGAFREGVLGGLEPCLGRIDG